MYLNHPLVPGFPIFLRRGQERDREFLTEAFIEVWAMVPEKDRAAILARGYGRIDVDILNVTDFMRPSEVSGEIRIKRSAVDTYSRDRIVYLVARELARKVEEYTRPDFLVLLNEPRRSGAHRVATIMHHWGITKKPGLELTPADEARVRANLALAAHDPPEEFPGP
jgi:hypothetical protein